MPEVMRLNFKACRGFCITVVFLYPNQEVEFVYSTTVNPYQPNNELHWTVCIIPVLCQAQIDTLLCLVLFWYFLSPCHLVAAVRPLKIIDFLEY